MFGYIHDSDAPSTEPPSPQPAKDKNDVPWHVAVLIFCIELAVMITNPWSYIAPPDETPKSK